MLASLIDLAKQPSSEKRRELMGQVATLFVIGAENHSNDELMLFNDVLIMLLDSVDVEGRLVLSEQIADNEYAPHELIVKLANDQAEVATPVLEQSPVLTEEDLIRLAKTKGQEYLLAISRRETLQSRLTDILLERGEQPVRRSVAENQGAELSQWGQRLLVMLAESDPVIRDYLTERHDLPQDTFDKLMQMLPEARREQVTALMQNNEQIARTLFREAGHEAAKVKLERRRTRLDAKVVLQEIKTHRRALDQTIVEFALSNNLYDLTFILGQLSGFGDKYVKNVMSRYENEGVAVMCKALEIGEPAFHALAKARCRHLKMPVTVADKWASDYQALPTSDAQRTVRFVKARLAAMEAEGKTDAQA